MKIISGILKGRNLPEVPAGKELRPILAQIKKSIFDIIKLIIADSDFLDLYAGVGSVGIEAISRGAMSADFVDFDFDAVNIIRETLRKFGVEKNAVVYHKDVLNGFLWLKNVNKGKTYDIIFMGPPYKNLVVDRTLALVKEAELLKGDGIIIAQHHKNEKVSAECFDIYREEKYGDTVVTFLKNKVVTTKARKPGSAE